MRSPLLIFALVLLSCSSSKQLPQTVDISGTYNDFFGNTISLHPDSTFKYTYQFDTVFSWNTGTWKMSGDTILFNPVLVYDTLITQGPLSEIREEILSIDETSELYIDDPESLVLCCFFQNQKEPPNKLFYKDQCLYKFDKSDNLITQKIRGVWTKKKWPPYYVKRGDLP